MSVNEALLFNVSETEISERNILSSYLNNVIKFNNKKSFESDSATPELKDNEISYVDESIVKEKVQLEQIRLDELCEELTSQLVTELKYFSADDSEISNAEKFALDIEENYSMRMLGETLQNVYVRCNDNHNILIGVCKIIERFELQEVMPWGPTMLVGLLSHKNETVKEYAVSVAENWADVELLPILRNLDCSSRWLKDYIDDVIKYLEGCHVLHKEIV